MVSSRSPCLRELTQNAIEAVLRSGARGQIIWDVDWISFDLGGGPMKVCIVGTPLFKEGGHCWGGCAAAAARLVALR